MEESASATKKCSKYTDAWKIYENLNALNNKSKSTQHKYIAVSDLANFTNLLKEIKTKSKSNIKEKGSYETNNYDINGTIKEQKLKITSSDNNGKIKALEYFLSGYVAEYLIRIRDLYKAIYILRQKLKKYLKNYTSYDTYNVINTFQKNVFLKNLAKNLLENYKLEGNSVNTKILKNLSAKELFKNLDSQKFETEKKSKDLSFIIECMETLDMMKKRLDDFQTDANLKFSYENWLKSSRKIRYNLYKKIFVGCLQAFTRFDDAEAFAVIFLRQFFVETAKTIKLIEYYAAAHDCEEPNSFVRDYGKIKRYYKKEAKKEEKKKEEPEENENMGFGLFD